MNTRVPCKKTSSANLPTREGFFETEAAAALLSLARGGDQARFARPGRRETRDGRDVGHGSTPFDAVHGVQRRQPGDRGSRLFWRALLWRVEQHRNGRPADDGATILVLHHNARGPR